MRGYGKVSIVKAQEHTNGKFGKLIYGKFILCVLNEVAYGGEVLRNAASKGEFCEW